ncbi:MAG TPA: TspO/MBR family protein [Xanthomonadales bacterium]|nr:TspO/MBR family protein [Xanthomonadales bacterium]
MVWVVFLILVFLAGSSGATFKPDSWYESLNKPAWTPPDWVFPVVWTVLYVLIAWAGVLVWEAQGFGLALVAWAAQWVFNAAWSWLFFGRRRMDQAFIDVSLLWLSVVAFIIAAWPVSQLAALLFVPYLVWVTTAAALNRAVWRLNPA